MKTLLLIFFLLAAPSLWAQVRIQTGDSITPIADVTITGSATLVRAASSDRISLSCTNTGTVNVRWGSSAVTATTGQRIPAGASVEIRTLGAIYMISEGSNSTVSCTEETL